jgi:hypothetical protein
VLDAPASNTYGCLSRDTCVSSNQVKGPVWNKIAYHHHEKPTLEEVFLSITNLILTGKQSDSCYCFEYRWFSFKGYLSFINLDE